MHLAVEFWHWWILGVVLFILEMIVPGAFFLWIGMSASVVGVIQLICASLNIHSTLEIQLIFFAVFSVCSVFFGKKYLKLWPVTPSNNTLNRRGASLIGRTVTLSEPIIDGRGHIKLDDSLWTATGPDCPINTHVQIIDVNGSLLIVKPLNEKA